MRRHRLRKAASRNKSNFNAIDKKLFPNVASGLVENSEGIDAVFQIISSRHCGLYAVDDEELNMSMTEKISHLFDLMKQNPAHILEQAREEGLVLSAYKNRMGRKKPFLQGKNLYEKFGSYFKFLNIFMGWLPTVNEKKPASQAASIFVSTEDAGPFSHMFLLYRKTQLVGGTDISMSEKQFLKMKMIVPFGNDLQTTFEFDSSETNLTIFQDMSHIYPDEFIGIVQIVVPTSNELSQMNQCLVEFTIPNEVQLFVPILSENSFISILNLKFRETSVMGHSLIGNETSPLIVAMSSNSLDTNIEFQMNYKYIHEFHRAKIFGFVNENVFHFPENETIQINSNLKNSYLNINIENIVPQNIYIFALYPSNTRVSLLQQNISGISRDIEPKQITQLNVHNVEQFIDNELTLHATNEDDIMNNVTIFEEMTSLLDVWHSDQIHSISSEKEMEALVQVSNGHNIQKIFYFDNSTIATSVVGLFSTFLENNQMRFFVNTIQIPFNSQNENLVLDQNKTYGFIVRMTGNIYQVPRFQIIISSEIDSLETLRSMERKVIENEFTMKNKWHTFLILMGNTIQIDNLSSDKQNLFNEIQILFGNESLPDTFAFAFDGKDSNNLLNTTFVLN
jgi:hypothetical protein